MNKQEASTSKEIESCSIFTLSKEPDTEGFDMQAGETWVYPTNYAVREYQYNIIQEALLKNTMVSLPTGLGKTFIAAVIMYNFYRWYPIGKVVFMAPTRPLVKQQVDACYNIMAIPKEVTAELTGTKGQVYRKDIWKEKRVFFITPQVLQNDLDILDELGPKIKCLVFDEAHKAKGNHAYCEVVRKISPRNKFFRVLGLSATPGNTLADVLGVIQNLLISHLEIRTDDSPDVTPYIFERSLESVVVPLGEKLEQVRDSYMPILEKYTRVLMQHKIIFGNCSTLTKGKIYITMKEYQERSRNGRDRNYAEIMRNLNICVTLYHAYELLIRHGLRGFLSFFEEHIDKPLLRGNTDLLNIMEDVRVYLGPAPNVETLPDGSIAEIPESSKFGHPKFYKLRDVLSEHFSDSSNSGSRVIVFCEYRESVMEAYALLLRHMPLIRPKIFLGQGAITQRQQINVIKAFKVGECNTLISTCIGEEGLDVGEVDLIVCFDISNKSPVRMVQRMGRTGRKRQGRVVILVTEGKEQQILKECLIHKQNLTNHILQSSALYKGMYSQNPRMVPAHIDPKCQKMFITVKKLEPNQQSAKKKNNSLKDMFDNILNKKLDSPLFHDEYDIDVSQINDMLPDKYEYWNTGNPISKEYNKNKMDFSKKLGKLRVLQPTGEIGHSKASDMLVSLLQFAESKKYNIPMTQVPVMPSQDSVSNKVPVNVVGLKQADIRNMFSKPACSSVFQQPEIPDTQMSKQHENQDLNDELLVKLQAEIASYLVVSISDDIGCKICDNLFDCSQFKVPRETFSIKSWIEPDHSVFESLTVENLTIFADSLNSKSQQLNGNLEKPTSHKDDTDAVLTDVNSNAHNRTESKWEAEQSVGYFDDTFGFRHSPFKPPDSVQKVLKKLNLDDSLFNNVAFSQLEKAGTSKAPSMDDKKENNIIPCTLMDMQAFDDAEFTQMKVQNDTRNIQEKEITSTTMKMTTVEDFFDFTCIRTQQQSPNSPKSDDTIVYSFTPENKKNTDTKCGSVSPILCSYDRVLSLKTKAHKRLFENSLQNESKTEFSDLNNFQQTSNSLIQSKRNGTEKFENSSLDIFNESADNTATNVCRPNLSKLLQEDIGKGSFYKSKKDVANTCSNSEQATIEEASNDTDLDDEADVIDTSLENCFESIATQQTAKRDSSIKPNMPKTDSERLKKNDENGVDVSDMCDLSIFGLNSNLIKSSNEDTQDTVKSAVNKEDSIFYRKVNNDKDITAYPKTANSIRTITESKYLRNSEHNSLQDAIESLRDFCGDLIFYMYFNDSYKTSEIYKKNQYENNFKAREINEFLTTSKEETKAAGIAEPSKKQRIPKGSVFDNAVSETNKELHTIEAGEGKDDAENYSQELSQWGSDSIWDVSLNWNSNKVNDKPKNNIYCSSEAQNDETMKNSPCKLSPLSSREWEEEFVDKDRNKLVTTQCDAKKLMEKENEIIDREQVVVDLTADSPLKQKRDPPDKIQQNKKVLSQTRLLDFTTKSNVDVIETHERKTKVQLGKKKTAAVRKSKLQLNRTDEKNSITSMQWFKKCAAFNTTSQTAPKLSTTVSSSKNIKSTQEDPISFTSNLKSNSSPTKSDSSDGSFVFTFSNASKCGKNPRNILSLGKKASPEEFENKKTLTTDDQCDTTPKKPMQCGRIHQIDLNSSDDDNDDDFEVPSKKGTGWIQLNKNMAKNRKSPLINKLSTKLLMPAKINERKNKSSKVKKKLNECPYIDLEAEVSSDEYATSDSAMQEVDDDKFEESFVDDDTQNIANNTMIHAKYLQSVRSPLLNRGKFKIPQQPNTFVNNVYSQVVDNCENTYINDSFCVNTEDIALSQGSQNLSELEIAELMLEQERKNKKKKRKKSDDAPKSKKRRVLQISSDSD